VPKGTPKAYMVTEGNGGNSQPVNSANNDKQNLVPENAECSSVESSVNTKEAIKKDFGNVEIENVSKANSDLECSSVTSLTAERNADKVEGISCMCCCKRCWMLSRWLGLLVVAVSSSCLYIVVFLSVVQVCCVFEE